MSATEPLTGTRIPTQSDGPLGGLQIANAVNDLADNTIPYFANASDRDTKFASWVAAGHTMRDGLRCHVQGLGDQVYLNGSWGPDGQTSLRATDHTTGGVTSATSDTTLLSMPVTVTQRDVAQGRRIVVHVRGNFGGTNLRVAALRNGAAFDPNMGEVTLAGYTAWWWRGTVGDATAGTHTITLIYRSAVSGSSVSAGPLSAYVEVI